MIIRDELITDNQAAALLGVDRRDVRWLAGNQQIGFEFVSNADEIGHNTYYFSRSEIQRREVWLKYWLEENPAPYRTHNEGRGHP